MHLAARGQYFSHVQKLLGDRGEEPSPQPKLYDNQLFGIDGGNGGLFAVIPVGAV